MFVCKEKKMFQLPKPSKEQQIVLDFVKNGFNVVVEALAGAGKTTMLLLMMLQNPEKKGFMISYNRGLVDETNAMLTKIEAYTNTDIKSRITVVTYHSLLSMIVNRVIDDDLLFLMAMDSTDFSTKRHNWKFANFDFVVIDEGQDMRKSYFELTMNLIVQCCQNPTKVQIIAVGDEIQLLYDFYAINRADSRFLTCMDELFKDISKRQWKHAQLTTSYRSTSPMAYFINSLFKVRTTIPKPINEIERAKECPVTVLICDIYKDAPHAILTRIKPNKSVLILCSSLNEKSPAVGIVDLLVSSGLNVHVARSGNLSDSGSSHINQSTTQNKILLKTMHGSKGIEADQDFIVLQDSPFDYYKKPLKNAVYVGLSRGREELVVIVDYRKVTTYTLERYIKENPQLKQKHVKIIVMRELKPGSSKDDLEDDTKEEKQQTNFTSNTLFSFIDVTHLQSLLKLIHIHQIQAPLHILQDNVPTEEDSLKSKQMEQYFHQMNVTYDQGLTYINVTNICGLALTMALEYTVTKCVPLLAHKMYYACLSKQNDDKYNHLRKQMESCMQELRNNTNNDVTDAVTNTLSKFKIFAKMGALFDAFSGYSEKLSFLKNYDFINKPSIFERYRALFGSLLTILSRHETKLNELVWYREETGRFKYDEKSITINVKPTLITKSGNLLIDIVHAPSISHEHHLSALIAAQIAGDAYTSVYVLNIGDGSIEHSKLHLLETEPIPQNLPQNEDLETILEAQHIVKKNNQESLNFISSAITFKLCKDETPDDGCFISTYHKLVNNCSGQRKLQEMNFSAVLRK